MEKLQIKDLRLVANAELRAQQPQGNTPEDAKTDDKQQQDKQPKTIEGYALRFNSPSKDLGGFIEVIDPKALDNVDLSNVIMLDQHDYSKPLASVKAGTLKLDVDNKGLHFVATLDGSVSYANDTFNNIQNGNVDSMSFRFDVDDGGDEFTQDEQGKVTRTIKQVKDLFEVSTVTIPAYDDSNVQVDKRSYEKFINDNSKEKDNNIMEKTIIKPQDKQNTEVRSFEKYVKTAGEVRDGLNTDVDGKAIIPTQIVTPIYKSKVGSNDLAAYVDVKKVSVGQGSYPIAKNDPSKVLATKAELAQIGDTDSGMTAVDFKCETRAGKVYLSQELLDDSAVDFKSEIQSQLSTLVKNTDNLNILKTLKGVPTKTVKTLDDVKALRNSLDFGLTPVVITNNDGFAYLDNLKDSQGHYILQPDVTIASGKSLFGCPIVVMNNKVLPDIKAGQFPIFIGDLQEAVALIRRNQITSSWTQFDSYSEGLAVIYRSDYKLKNADAVVAMTLATQD